MPDAAHAGFQTSHRAGLLLLSLALFALVLELVRRGRLKERYALLWLAAALGSLLLGIFPQVIARLAQVLHVQYLTVVFAITFLFLLILVLALSAVISRLSERNRELAQEVALLDHRLRQLERGAKDQSDA